MSDHPKMIGYPRSGFSDLGDHEPQSVMLMRKSGTTNDDKSRPRHFRDYLGDVHPALSQSHHVHCLVLRTERFLSEGH
jgi:hypothetical protein